MVFTVWRYVVAVELYWQDGDILWQCNYIDTMMVFCGRGFILTVWRCVVAVEFYWQYAGVLWQWKWDALQLLHWRQCQNRVSVPRNYTSDSVFGRRIPFIHVFPRRAWFYVLRQLCLGVPRNSVRGAKCPGFCKVKRMWYFWQQTVNLNLSAVGEIRTCKLG